jgi:hypothetical protein
MATKPVARKGDVTATVGTMPYTGASSGTWSPGTLTVTTAPLASSDGNEVVVKAESSFTFLGSSGNTTIKGDSSVVLSPGPQLLTIDGSAPLVHGDSAQDAYGNTVSVSSSATLHTASP